MILLNTTYVVDSATEKMWLFWMRETLLPLIEETGMCSNVRFYHLQKIQPDADETYALQLEFKSNERVVKYSERFNPSFDALMIKRFGSTVTAFRTMLDELYRTASRVDDDFKVD